MLGLQTLTLELLALLVLSLILFLSAQARCAWRTLVIRNRWLLFMLFVVFAYGLPGEGIGGFEWAPAAQGLQEALLHTLRLLTLLGILSNLLTQFSHSDLLLGLWTLLTPLRHIGFPVERSIVRLALVLEALGDAHINRRKNAFPRLNKASLSQWQGELRRVLSPPTLGQEQQFGQIPIHPRAWALQDVVLLLVCQIPLLSYVFSQQAPQ